MPIYKKIIFSAIIIAAFFACAELASRVFVMPGSYDYIERRIIEEGLSRRKKPGEFRIFLYGESTMHGGALYPRSVIAKWLKLYLSDLLPEGISRDITIVNFGRMGADSTFVANAFAETIAYKPDLAVFYIAHNDFCLAEYRLKYVSKKTLSELFDDFCEALPKASSFISIFNRLGIRAKILRYKAADARAELEDPWYGESDEPEAFRKDSNLLRPGSPQFRLVEENFKSNIERIIKTARRNSVPVIFFEGLSRWKDFEPVRSMHGETVTGEALSAWNLLFAEAESLFARGEYAGALHRYGKCIEADPSYALAYYRAGECHEKLGRSDKANHSYALANDRDYFPIRAPSAVNRFYDSIIARGLKDVYIIRTQPLIEAASPRGIVDSSLTIDQIHPSCEGQAIMALEIAKIMHDNNMPAPRDKWRWDKLRDTGRMKASLGLDSRSMFHIYTGTASYLTKHYRQTAVVLEKALAIKPGSILARSWLAWAYWKLGEKDRASAIYAGLYRDNPSLTSAFFRKHPEIKDMVDRRTN